MKKIVTFAMVTGAALALSACGKKEEAPAPEAAPTEEMMAPATTETPMAEETLDPTGNPIRPAAAPAAAVDEATPAAQ